MSSNCDSKSQCEILTLSSAHTNQSSSQIQADNQTTNFLTSNHSLSSSQTTLASNQTSLKCSAFNNLDVKYVNASWAQKKEMRMRINEHLKSMDEYLEKIGLCYESVNLAPFEQKKVNIKIEHKRYNLFLKKK